MNVLKTFHSQVLTLKKYSLNGTKYYISIRGPKLWNHIINKEEKHIQSYSLSKEN